VLRVSRAQIYRVIFILAGVYNIAVGLWAAIAPRAFFDVFELGPPSHPAIWACLGMVIGLYGLIYFKVAFTEPSHITRFLIGIGLAGKVLGPIGFVLAVQNGELPLRMFPLVALDDLVWWAPFALYLIDGTRLADALARQTPRICAVAHVAAGVATLAWITGGSEAEPDLVARGAFIAAHANTWRAAWLIWMAAAISTGAFFCWWAARARKPSLAEAALFIGFTAIIVDFFADALFIGWIPEHDASLTPFTTFVSQVVANGLYSIAGAILMVASAPIRPWFRAWGWTVWLAGFALAVAGAMRWDAAIAASAGLLLATFTPWVWFANRFLHKTP
jgi:hypothetical protein